ncbi:glycosyltransferase [Microbacterium sp. cx-55]|uniref:glycosyltransferase n=1 Tax=Microbacterium sp. cx-55 TaxID=2875948 RepID=UPI001CBB5573|nr:glycosyltransferase [Microbacterium sp. cx-55]UGB35804.1 glycosyltransferase [Microbacterium sp. cx-55]
MSFDVLIRAADAPPTAADTIRVASVPASHVYVRHLDPVIEGGELPRIVRLADPDPASPARSTVSRWWPPVMLDSEWVRANDFDVFHIQFGFDARTPAELQALVDALRRAGRPLVYTVHDLRNPHHETSAEHDAQLDVLVPAADALITLTPGAADEIRRRWGREAIVLPHPHVVEPDRIRAVRPRRESGEFRVGLHVKSLRASMNPLAVLRVLTDAVNALPGGVLQVNGHRDVLLPGGARYDAELGEFLQNAEAAGLLETRVHDFLPDDELWDYLESLDVSVLPYRFGTHSGWLEACRDLGTAVIAPDCGYYREQGPVFRYGNDGSGLDAASLTAAVRAAFDAGPTAPLSVDERMQQRQHVADAHARLYRDLLS